MSRNLDLAMKEIQNAKERDADDWKKLFEDADPRFKFKGIKTPVGSILSMISATWEVVED